VQPKKSSGLDLVKSYGSNFENYSLDNWEGAGDWMSQEGESLLLAAK